MIQELCLAKKMLGLCHAQLVMNHEQEQPQDTLTGDSSVTDRKTDVTETAGRPEGADKRHESRTVETWERSEYGVLR